MPIKYNITRYAVFFNYLRIEGYSSDSLKALRLEHVNWQISCHVSLDSSSCQKAFAVDLLCEERPNLEDIHLILVSQGGMEQKITYNDILGQPHAETGPSEPERLFFDELSKQTGSCLLELGGRQIQGRPRHEQFKEWKYTSFDILPHESVDVVGDAHHLSGYFAKDAFDFVISYFVFEHLIMPWQVVCELGKIVKLGGLVLISTHQTIGMHHLPWDFFRFSADAWRGLFNKYTGFEIVSTSLRCPQHILPMIYRHMNGATAEPESYERSAGFRESVVLARKISAPSVNWDIDAKQLICESYPSYQAMSMLRG